MKHRKVKTMFLMLMAFSTIAIAGSPDEDAVIATIENNAKAASAFPRTLDENAMLKQYAPDAVVINDGEFSTTQKRKESLAQVVELVNLGNNIGLSIRATEIKVRILQPGLAWVVYDSAYKIAIAGKVVEEQANKCSGLYKKVAANWLIQDEHCSTIKPKEEPASVDPCNSAEGCHIETPNAPEETGAVPLQ